MKTMHFSCQPEAAFWPIYLYRTTIYHFNHLCKQKRVKDWKNIVSFFLSSFVCVCVCVWFIYATPYVILLLLASFVSFHFSFVWDHRYSVTFSFTPSFFRCCGKGFKWTFTLIYKDVSAYHVLKLPANFYFSLWIKWAKVPSVRFHSPKVCSAKALTNNVQISAK